MSATTRRTKALQRSWFSIIMMVFLCLLWTIPTLGLLVSSFRPRDRSGAQSAGGRRC